MKKYLDIYRKNNFSTPFEYAEHLNIRLIYENLGAINGYYNKMNRQKFIHINSNIKDHEKTFTCAHELGHALLHPSVNTSFLLNSTLLSVNKLEIEANTFAINLLISDEELEHYKNYTVDQLSALYGCSSDLIKLRMKK